MLNAEYDDRKDVLYMYYEYNPYLSYGEDRSFQLPPCSQEVAVAAHRVVQRFLVSLAVKAPILHTFQAEDPVHISPEAFQVQSRVQHQAYLRN